MKELMQAVIFDMDGLLVDSEPLWREAEIEVFGSVGVQLDDAMCRQTTGLRHDEVVRYWHARHPWDEPGLEEMTQLLIDTAERMIFERGEMMPGAEATIALLHKMGLKLAIASSSPMRLINVVVKKFTLDAFFSVLQSADDMERGKPDPAVYLATIEKIGVEPSVCVALEDSVSGVRAAKAAGTYVIAVPDPHAADRPEFNEADLVLPSLVDFSPEFLSRS